MISLKKSILISLLFILTGRFCRGMLNSPKVMVKVVQTLNRAISHRNLGVIANTLKAIPEAKQLAIDFQDNTALHFAAKVGNVKMVKIILASEGDVKATNANGSTPLHCAIAANNTKKTIIALLLQGKADINARDRFGLTPLHLAILFSKSYFISYLLSIPGINVEVPDNNGLTPLLTAIKLHNTEAIIMLLTMTNANEHALANNGASMEDLALEYGTEFAQFVHDLATRPMRSFGSMVQIALANPESYFSEE